MQCRSSLKGGKQWGNAKQKERRMNSITDCIHSNYIEVTVIYNLSSPYKALYFLRILCCLSPSYSMACRFNALHFHLFSRHYLTLLRQCQSFRCFAHTLPYFASPYFAISQPFHSSASLFFAIPLHCGTILSFSLTARGISSLFRSFSVQYFSLADHGCASP